MNALGYLIRFDTRRAQSRRCVSSRITIRNKPGALKNENRLNGSIANKQERSIV
jgi:hypothetical protein